MTEQRLTRDQKARLNRLVGLGVPFNRALKISADNLPLTKEERDDAKDTSSNKVEVKASAEDSTRVFKVTLQAGMTIERCATGQVCDLTASLEVEAVKDRGFILFHIDNELYRLYLRKYFLRFEENSLANENNS